MTIEEKAKIDESPEVDRMGVYEFLDVNGIPDGKVAVVVSADHRKHDRFASIIMLTPYELERGGGDAIGVPLPIGDYIIHCGMVTYVRRDRLGKKLCKIGANTRKKITKMIGVELGVIHDGRESVWQIKDEPDWKAEAIRWKGLYENLVAAIGAKPEMSEQEAWRNGY